MADSNIAIIGISGSLRKESYNTALLRNAAELVPDGCTLEIANIADIPLFNADVQSAEGIPTAVEQVKEQIAQSDALLVATPEYNHSMPGVLKNALDWISRPGSDIKRVFGGKPVGVIGATPGGMGTILSQTSWLPVWRAFGMAPWFGKSLYLSKAHESFDDALRLTDEKMRDRLSDYVTGFAAYARNLKEIDKET